MELVIRRLKKEDSIDLARLFERNNCLEITKHFNPFPLTKDTAEQLASTPGLDLYFIAYLYGNVEGFGMLRGWNEGFEIPSFGIFVDQAHQGKGIGRSLTKVVLEEARQLARGVRLTVNQSNQKAIDLYMSLNFKIISASDQEEKEAIFVMLKMFDD